MFWLKVDRQGPVHPVLKTRCWIWGGYVDKGTGYGMVGSGSRKKGPTTAHRRAWELGVGPIPDGLYVCHSCHNRICVNYLEHLHLGTALENMAESAMAGRLSHGVGRPGSKLTDDIVAMLRLRYLEGEPVRNLAVKYGVSVPTAIKAIRGKTWGHVLMPPVPTARQMPASCN